MVRHRLAAAWWEVHGTGKHHGVLETVGCSSDSWRGRIKSYNDMVMNSLTLFVPCDDVSSI